MSEDLKDRFKSHQPDDQPDEEDEEEKQGELVPGETEKQDIEDIKPETTFEPSKTPVRDRTQVPMYLSDDREEALKSLYNEVDGRAKIAGEDGISKNDEFYPALVDFVTDKCREEFIEFLDLHDEN